jgi:hypothetical protein
MTFHSGKLVWVFFVPCLIAVLASAQPSVTISNPANNEVAVTPTLGVDASATGSSSMYVIQIYLQGHKVTESLCHGANPCQIHTTISISAGNGERLSVQVLNSSGGFIAKQTIFFNATSAPTVISGIEDSAASWTPCIQANGCSGGGGGGNALQPANCGPPSCPSEDTNENSIQFTTIGESGFNNCNPNCMYGSSYWFVVQPQPSTSISYLKYQFDLWVPSAYASLPQALEFECQLTLGGNTYNFSWQADYKGTGNWRIFNYQALQWESSGLSVSAFSGGSWHNVIAEFHVDPADPDSKPVHHDALWIDGVRMVPSQNSKHAVVQVGNPNKFTNAFQIDMDFNNDPLTVYVDRMSVTYTTI